MDDYTNSDCVKLADVTGKQGLNKARANEMVAAHIVTSRIT